MSELTYATEVSSKDKPLVWLVFAKTSQTTPKKAIEVSQQRLRRYDEASKGKT